MKRKVDLVIDIAFDINDPDKSIIKTNVKEELLGDLIGDWLRGQLGLGEDGRQANEKDVYSIKIGIDLSDDTFIVESDTGNDGLTSGIVMDVSRRLDRLAVKPL